MIMILWFLRGLFGILVVGLATSVMLDLSHRTGYESSSIPLIVFVAVIAVGAGTVILDLSVRNKQITTISAIYFGLLLGFLLGTFFWTALEPVLIGDTAGKPPSTVLLLRLLVTLVCCYVTVSTLLQTKDEFRFIIPYVEFSKQMKGNRPMVLDTSVIIDGRIADICDTWIIDSKLIVPRFVLQELQNIADSGDKLKRNRGRRGLDMLKRMQSNTKVELHMHEANLPELREVHKVDERLVILAKT